MWWPINHPLIRKNYLSMTQTISPEAAKREIHGAKECALLDIREHGLYGEGHPFLSVHCPYSDFEQTVVALVPNRQVSVILMDDGDGISERAADLLMQMGYRQVSILKGGAPAWAAAGYTLYKGVNLPSKTLGELIEHHDHPQIISPATLHQWQTEGRPLHFFDCRPPNEYDKMTIPGARCVPNGELAHRLAAVVTNDSDPIVVTCAGRTRGLIGASGLQRLKLNNPIYAVENGTQGWALSGFTLNRGNGRPEMPALSQSELETSRQRADALIAAEKLVCIDVAAFQELARDQDRTLYLVDVRSLMEFKAGHLPHAVHAWSGQIAQAADLTIGVRRARVVLSDDTGMRAAIAAIWLRALNYEVYIIRETNSGALPSDWRENAPARSPVDLLKQIPVSSAIAQISGGGVRVIDIRNSQAFRRAHIPGALWANRARLGAIPNDCPVILCTDDAVAAAYLARDLRSRGVTINGLLEGGLAAWQSAGQPIAVSPDHPADGECIDFLFFVHDRHDGNLDSARRYLEWETGLIAQLDPEEQQSFRLA